jgi:hypothetical protein
MPSSTCSVATGLARISWRKSRATPAQAMAEPATKLQLTFCLRNSQASALFGTIRSANTVATSPLVT